MPMYDYRCKACGARFEAWQKFTDDPISVCPTCSGPAQRVIHAAGIMFKGSGFYSTDSKSHAAIPPADAEAAPAASDGTAAKKTSDASAPVQSTPGAAPSASTNASTNASTGSAASAPAAQAS